MDSSSKVYIDMERHDKDEAINEDSGDDERAHSAFYEDMRIEDAKVGGSVDVEDIHDEGEDDIFLFDEELPEKIRYLLAAPTSTSTSRKVVTTNHTKRRNTKEQEREKETDKEKEDQSLIFSFRDEENEDSDDYGTLAADEDFEPVNFFQDVRLLEECCGNVETISSCISAIKEEIQDTPLEHSVGRVLEKIAIPEAMVVRKGGGVVEKKLKERMDHTVKVLQSIWEEIDIIIGVFESGPMVDNLVKIKEEYLSFAQKLFPINFSDSSRGGSSITQNSLAITAKISMHNLGTRELLHSDTIMPLNEQGLLKVGENNRLTTQFGELQFRYLLHNESQDKSLHEHPGAEFAIESLRLCLNGMGSTIAGGTVMRARGRSLSPAGSQIDSSIRRKQGQNYYNRKNHSALVMLSRGINREPALVSRTIDHIIGRASGITFLDSGNYASYNIPIQLAGEKWALSMKGFSILVIQSLLTDPSDGLLDNFVVRKLGKRVNDEDASSDATRPNDIEEKQEQAQRNKLEEVELIRINTGGCFANPVYYNWERSVHFLGIRNMLYCFPHMNGKVDKDVAHSMVNLPPEHVILNWLKDMTVQNQQYHEMFSQHTLTEQELEMLHLPVRLSSRAVGKAYERLCSIRDYLRDHPNATLMNLLKEVDPIVHCYYKNLQLQFGNDLEGAQYALLSNEETYSIERYLAKDIADGVQQPPLPLPIQAPASLSFASLLSLPRKLSGNSAAQRNKQQQQQQQQQPQQQPQPFKIDIESLGKIAETDFLEERRELPEDLLLEWLSRLDFSLLNPFDQDVVLLQTNSLLRLTRRQGKAPWRKELKKKNNTKVVTIQNCVAVDDLKFLKAIIHSKRVKHLILRQCHSITDELAHELCHWKASHLKITFDKCESLSQKCKAAIEAKNEELFGGDGAVEVILAGYEWNNHNNKNKDSTQSSVTSAVVGTSPPSDEMDNDEMEDIIIAEWGVETMNVKTESERILRKKREAEQRWREMEIEEERYLTMQRLGEQDEMLLKAESEKKKLTLQSRLQKLEADRVRSKKALTDNYAERARLSELEFATDTFDSASPNPRMSELELQEKQLIEEMQNYIKEKKQIEEDLMRVDIEIKVVTEEMAKMSKVREVELRKFADRKSQLDKEALLLKELETKLLIESKNLNESTAFIEGREEKVLKAEMVLKKEKAKLQKEQALLQEHKVKLKEEAKKLEKKLHAVVDTEEGLNKKQDELEKARKEVRQQKERLRVEKKENKEELEKKEKEIEVAEMKIKQTKRKIHKAKKKLKEEFKQLSEAKRWMKNKKLDMEKREQLLAQEMNKLKKEKTFWERLGKRKEKQKEKEKEKDKSWQQSPLSPKKLSPPNVNTLMEKDRLKDKEKEQEKDKKKEKEKEKHRDRDGLDLRWQNIVAKVKRREENLRIREAAIQGNYRLLREREQRQLLRHSARLSNLNKREVELNLREEKCREKEKELKEHKKLLMQVEHRRKELMEIVKEKETRLSMMLNGSSQPQEIERRTKRLMQELGEALVREMLAEKLRWQQQHHVAEDKEEKSKDEDKKTIASSGSTTPERKRREGKSSVVHPLKASNENRTSLGAGKEKQKTKDIITPLSSAGVFAVDGDILTLSVAHMVKGTITIGFKRTKTFSDLCKVVGGNGSLYLYYEDKEPRLYNLSSPKLADQPIDTLDEAWQHCTRIKWLEGVGDYIVIVDTIDRLEVVLHLLPTSPIATVKQQLAFLFDKPATRIVCEGNLLSDTAVVSKCGLADPPLLSVLPSTGKRLELRLALLASPLGTSKTNTLSVDAEDTDALWIVKKMILDKLGEWSPRCSVDSLRLYWKSELLADDNKPLEQYGITDGATLSYMLTK